MNRKGLITFAQFEKTVIHSNIDIIFWMNEHFIFVK